MQEFLLFLFVLSRPLLSCSFLLFPARTSLLFEPKVPFLHFLYVRLQVYLGSPRDVAAQQGVCRVGEEQIDGRDDKGRVIFEHTRSRAQYLLYAPFLICTITIRLWCAHAFHFVLFDHSQSG